MRSNRALAWVAGGAALVGAALLRARLRAAPAPPPAADPAADPAEELRRKLAETRTTPEPAVTKSQDVPGATTTEAPPEERRLQVHEQGRTAVERMRSPAPTSPDAEP